MGKIFKSFICRSMENKSWNLLKLFLTRENIEHGFGHWNNHIGRACIMLWTLEYVNVSKIC